MTRVHETVHGRGRARWPRSGSVRGRSRDRRGGHRAPGAAGRFPGHRPSPGPTAPRSFPPLSLQEHLSSGGPDLSLPQWAAVHPSVPGREHSRGNRSHAPRRARVSNGFLCARVPLRRSPGGAWGQRTRACGQAVGSPGGEGSGSRCAFQRRRAEWALWAGPGLELVKTRGCLPSGVPSPTRGPVGGSHDGTDRT